MVVSHRMHHFHILDQVIIDAYLERLRKNDWDECENRDDEEFLKLEAELWSKMYPEQANSVEMEEEEGGVEESCEAKDDSSTARDIGEGEEEELLAYFEGHGNEDVINLPLPSTERTDKDSL